MIDLGKLTLPQVSCYLRHKVLPLAARDLESLQQSDDPATKLTASSLKEALAVFASLAMRLSYEDDDGDDSDSGPPDDHDLGA
jgi:hypothetical protein